MAKAQTITTAKTVARIKAIKSNIFGTLRQCVDVNDSLRKSVEIALDEQLIDAVKVLAFNKDRVCVQMLRLDVNWDTYGVHIKNGRDTIQVDKRYANFNGDDIAARFDEVVADFNELTVGLDIEWTIEVSNKITVEKFVERFKSYGWKNRKDPIKWGNNFEKTHYASEANLDELTISIHVADD